MSRKMILLIAILTLVSIFAVACGSNNETTNTSESTNTSTNETPSTDSTVNNGEKQESVELVMYSWRPEDRAIYEKAFAAFNEENPNIKINFQPYKSTEYNTILTNALVSGTGPDIIQLRPYSGASSIADNGYLEPLDNIQGLSNIQDQYLDAARGSDGKVYGVPLTLNAGVIFYNKQIFEDKGLTPPTTWEELIEVSKTLKEQGIIPIAQAGRAAYLLSMTHAVIGPTAYGGNEFVPKVTAEETDLKDPAFIESIKRMEELAQYFPKDFIALEDKDVQTLFYTGQAAMYINGDYRLATFKKNAPDLKVGVIPGLALEKGQDPLVTTWVDGSYAVVSKSPKKEAALKFMEFMTSKKFGEIFTNESERTTAVSGITAQDEIVNTIAQAGSANPTPYLLLVYFGEGEPTTKTVFENSLQGMYLGELTVDGVAEKAQENYERAKASE